MLSSLSGTCLFNFICSAKLSQGFNTSTITDSIFDSFSRYKLCTLSGIQCLTFNFYQIISSDALHSLVIYYKTTHPSRLGYIQYVG